MSEETTPGAEEWIAAFAARVGVEAPDPATFGALLKLAAIAAHASERTAAPVACYLAGISGRPLDELQALADEI